MLLCLMSKFLHREQLQKVLSLEDLSCINLMGRQSLGLVRRRYVDSKSRHVFYFTADLQITRLRGFSYLTPKTFRMSTWVP